MKIRMLRVKGAILVAIALNVLRAVAGSSVLARELGRRPAIASQVSANTQTGQSQTVHGVTVTAQELRSRPEPPKGSPREATPRRTSAARANAGQSPSASQPPRTSSGQKSPQTLVDEIIGPAITDTLGFVPPDTMGAVGSTQFLFAVNGRFRGFNKNTPHTQIFDVAEATFWGATADAAGVSDAHVRYDRLTQRWFMIEIDVKASANHILLAVSATSDLSTTTWTQFQIPATGITTATDQGCFDDYPTPGI